MLLPCESLLEEDPEAHSEEGDGHSSNDCRKLQGIGSNKATDHDPGENPAK